MKVAGCGGTHSLHCTRIRSVTSLPDEGMVADAPELHEAVADAHALEVYQLQLLLQEAVQSPLVGRGLATNEMLHLHSLSTSREVSPDGLSQRLIVRSQSPLGLKQQRDLLLANNTVLLLSANQSRCLNCIKTTTQNLRTSHHTLR